ncbi:ABC transporter permease [Algoriphagus namhaensis]
MFRNYLKIGLRNLLKNRVFTGINMIGLSISIAASLLILNYLNEELSYDRFHSKSEQVYRIVALGNEDLEQGSALSPSLVGVELKRNFPEVAHATRMILPWSGQAATSTLASVSEDAQVVKQSFNWGFFVDPDFFEIFDFPMILGNAEVALAGENQVVLSESAVRKIFGPDWKQRDLLGQELEYVNEFDRFRLTLTGVISDAPSNSHFDYDFLASFSTLNTGWGKDYVETWDGHSVYNYLELQKAVDPSSLLVPMNKLVKDNQPEGLDPENSLLLQPLEDIHLYSALENELKVNGSISNVYFLSVLAILILAIAAANYINLTISISLTRMKEIGLRKVIGAGQRQLILQFLTESALLITASFLLALVILFLAEPSYLKFTGVNIHLSEPSFWIAILMLLPVFAILSGLYPAGVLSKLSVERSLKGQLTNTGQGQFFKKGLLVFQFAASIVLIDFTSVLLDQVSFMQNQDAGFSKEGVVVIKGPEIRNETWIEHDQKPAESNESDPFIDRIDQFSTISSASLSWSIPGESEHLSGISLGDEGEGKRLDFLNVDDQFAQVYELKLLAGSFSTSKGIVINESALALLGFSSPEAAVGQVIRDDRQLEYPINGVVQDYHHFGFKEKIKPLAFAENDPSYALDSFYSLKMNQSGVESTMEQLETSFREVYPNDPFEYFFIDEHFEQQYLREQSFGRVFGIFALLTIFIACIGLFGLSLQSAISRTKEIGIRKVLGAREWEIMATLLKSTLITLGISVALAIPLGYFLSESWLEGFAYRVHLTCENMWMGSVIILVLGLITVSYHAATTALANPVKSLRSE